jgi:glucose-6-phosphate 1-dehydrogenase
LAESKEPNPGLLDQLAANPATVRGTPPNWLLPEHVTEIRVIFRRPPKLAFAPTFAPDPDELVLRIDPDPGIALVVQAKQPGGQATRTVDLSLIFAEELGEAPQPYERLLGDALKGDPGLFTREDSVEETWRTVQPLLDAPPHAELYKPGSWGPGSADRLVAGHPSWRDPWLRPRSGRRHQREAAVGSERSSGTAGADPP